MATNETVVSLDQLAGRKFATIYADPPWRYANVATRAAAADHYGTLSVDELCVQPIQSLAADNCHLHLWATSTLLADALTVMSAWGFTYKSSFVWVKPQLGMGNYWRISHEFLLFGIRGKMPFADHSLRSWAEISRTKHSKKPRAVREMIESASPPPYLELYGRESLPDSEWTVYGNQVEARLF